MYPTNREIFIPEKLKRIPIYFLIIKTGDFKRFEFCNSIEIKSAFKESNLKRVEFRVTCLCKINVNRLGSIRR